MLYILTYKLVAQKLPEVVSSLAQFSIYH